MRTCYIPIRRDIDLLLNAISSLYEQVDNFIVINNTEDNLKLPISVIDKKDKVYFIDTLEPLCIEQSLNLAIKNRYFIQKEHDFMLWAHNDIVAQPGAIEALFKKYDEVKDTKWGIIYGCYDTLCLYNPNFFVKENIWGEPLLFPFYFGDNHRWRMMDLRGYARIDADMDGLVKHLGSQTIKRHDYFRHINDLTFNLESQLYVNIWGGPPSKETNNDPTCGGLYPQ